jgi:hypothetical protein
MFKILNDGANQKNWQPLIHFGKLILAIPIFLLFYKCSSLTPAEEIYRLTFSDSTNFTLMNDMGHTSPEDIIILDTAQGFDYTIFWTKVVGGETPEQIESDTMTSRHGDYDPEYLFRDSLMINAIDSTERKKLRRRTLRSEAKRISLHGPHYKTISDAKDIKGFYVTTSYPLFSSDGKYAFMVVEMFFNDGVKNIWGWGEVFGYTTLVYEKQAFNRWKKFKKIDHLIL